MKTDPLAKYSTRLAALGIRAVLDEKQVYLYRDSARVQHCFLTLTNLNEWLDGAECQARATGRDS